MSYDELNSRVRVSEPIGGDPVCWLHLLCPECGAMIIEEDAPCWRCSDDSTSPEGGPRS